MDLLDISGGKVILKPETLTITQFKKIWDKYKNKEDAIEDFSFIILMKKFNSPYSGYNDKDRIDKVIKDVITRKDWKIYPDLEEAMNKYEELCKSPAILLLEDITFSMNNIRNYFRNYDPDTDKDGKITNNLINNAKRIGDLLDGIEALRDRIKKEVQEAKHVRGGGELNRREQVRIKNKE